MLGAYAYDWNTTTKKTETITFKDAMSRASYAGVDATGEKTETGPPRFNGQYQYSEPSGEHTVSFLDAISFYNHLRVVRAAEFGGIGIVRLGTEDPQIWDVLELKGVPTPSVLKALGAIKAGDTITNVGRGEIVTVDTSRMMAPAWSRSIARRCRRPARAILSRPRCPRCTRACCARTTPISPPIPFSIIKAPGGEHEVAITFDDGPDPEWTPKILDILRARGVKACFFLLGSNCGGLPRSGSAHRG